MTNWPAALEWVHGGNAVPAAAGLMLALAGCARLLRRKSRDVYKRGVLLADGRRLQRWGARTSKSRAGVLTLAGIAIAAADETKHFKLIGTTSQRQFASFSARPSPAAIGPYSPTRTAGISRDSTIDIAETSY
jgi:hypothetical protein